MSGPNRNPNFYSDTGRPLTMADFNVGREPIRGHGLSSTEGSSQFSSAFGSRYYDRNFNPQMESTQYNLSKARADSTNRNTATNQTSSLESNEYAGRQFNPLLDLECEMARSKNKALERLRNEQNPNCDAPLRAKKAREAIAKRLDARDEVQRNALPSECVRPVHDNVYASRRVDTDRVNHNNIPVRSPVGSSAHPLDMQGVTTFRHLKHSTPKQQRATSCPTPVQRVSPHASVQRMPRVCPRPPFQPVCIPAPQTGTASSSNNARYQIAFQSQPRPSTNVAVGVCPPTVTTTTTTKPNARPQSPSHNPISTTHATSSPLPHTIPESSAHIATPRSPDSTFTVPRDRYQRHDATNNSHVTQDSIPHMDTAYGQSPPRAPPQQYFQTPGRPLNVTDQSTTTSLQLTDASVGTPNMSGPDSSQMQRLKRHDISTPSADQSLLRAAPTPSTPHALSRMDQHDETHSSVEPRRSPRARQPQVQDSMAESHYYNASIFDEPSNYRRQPNNECIPSDYIDLTDETRYEYNDMEISDEDIPVQSTPVQQDGSRRLHTWSIPADDITCQHPDEAEGDSTQYMELPAYCPPQIQQPCDQPRASLFRCLAQKLSSTYNFISSLVAPQRSATALAQPMEQAADQVCEDFGSSAHYSAERAGATAYDLRNLYAMQCSDAANHGLNTLLGIQTSLRDAPVCTRECASAKRCGHVQFDRSDRHELQDPHRRAIHNAEIENLVNDAYSPGTIQDTIDGRDNFNYVAFDIYARLNSRDHPSIQDPMTLLEAFAKRIEKERQEVNKIVKENPTKEKLAEIVQQYFENLNHSDLNRSIKSFLLSEHLQDHEEIEKSRGTSWKAEVQKAITNWPDNTAIKVITYTGRTMPTQNA